MLQERRKEDKVTKRFVTHLIVPKIHVASTSSMHAAVGASSFQKAMIDTRQSTRYQKIIQQMS
jgi:hypothetical protein